MATKAALEHMALEENKRHNVVNENLSAGQLAVAAASAGANLIRQVAGTIGAIAALNPDMYRHNDNAIETTVKKSFHHKKGQPIGDTILVDAGIVVSDFIPTIGTMPGSQFNEAFQSMFQAIFQIIRGQQSGSVNYDYVDLGQAVLGLDSLRIVYEDVLRALDLATYAEAHNSYAVDALIKACGYDKDYLNANRAGYIATLNKFALDMAETWLPGNLDYMKRHANMAGLILRDNTGFKTNYYIYKIRGIFKYDELNSKLVFSADTRWRNSLPELQALLNDFKRRYKFSDALSIMSGDVIKAIENGRISAESIYKFPKLTLDDGEMYHKELFCISELDLSSFRNQTIFAFDSQHAEANYSISQYYDAQSAANFIYQGELDSNHLPKGLMFKNPTNADGPIQGTAIEPIIIRSDFDEPSSDSIIEDTRLAVPYSDTEWPAAGTKPLIPIGTHCSEVCVGLSVWSYVTKTNWNNNDVKEYFIDSTHFTDDGGHHVKQMQQILNNIKYLPMVIAYYGEGPEFTQMFAPYYNAEVFDPSELANINDMAMRSLLYYDPKGSASDTRYPRNESKFSPEELANKKGPKLNAGSSKPKDESEKKDCKKSNSRKPKK